MFLRQHGMEADGGLTSGRIASPGRSSRAPVLTSFDLSREGLFDSLWILGLVTGGWVATEYVDSS